MRAWVGFARARRWHAHFTRIAPNIGAHGVDAFAIAWVANLLATAHAIAKVLGAGTVDTSFVRLAAFGARRRASSVVARCAGRTWVWVTSIVNALPNVVRVRNAELARRTLAWQIKTIQTEAAAAFFTRATGNVRTQIFALTVVLVTRKAGRTIHI